MNGIANDPEASADSGAGSPWPWWKRALAVVAPWTALALVYIPGTLYLDRDAVQPEGWQFIVPHWFTVYLLWAAFTPAVARCVRAFPLRWPPSARTLGAHAALLLVLVAIHALAMSLFNVLHPPPSDHLDFIGHIVQELNWRAPQGILLYASTAAVLSAWEALQRAHAREQQWVEARLDALQAQIEPHFLFNTLNALSELVYHDPARADQALTRLARLLRHRFVRGENTRSLAEEMQMLREYVAIQDVLLGPRLRMVWRIDDGTLGLRVPALILQPLLENAIQHGIAALRDGGEVAVEAHVANDALRLRVSNDGPPAQEGNGGNGVGLRNTRERLQAMYGERAALHVALRAGGGADVEIVLPAVQGGAGHG